MHDGCPELDRVRSARAAGAARRSSRARSSAIARGGSSRRTTSRWRCARCSPDRRRRAARHAGARARGKSLAVLPFVNAGADPQIEHLADGITESIINSLSQLAGLRVVPRSLAFRYKGLQADPATVGLALNARTILTGRVVSRRRAEHPGGARGHRHRVAAVGRAVPAEHAAICMTVQEEIAWQISEALRLKLTGEQKKKLRKRPTVNPEAYQEYLRGRYHWNNFSPDSLRRALEHFERAIELDPAYALAYAGLGDAFGAMAYYGFIAAGRRVSHAHARPRGARSSSTRSSPTRTSRSASSGCSGGGTGTPRERELADGDRG